MILVHLAAQVVMNVMDLQIIAKNVLPLTIFYKTPNVYLPVT